MYLANRSYVQYPTAEKNDLENELHMEDMTDPEHE